MTREHDIPDFNAAFEAMVAQTTAESNDPLTERMLSQVRALRTMARDLGRFKVRNIRGPIDSLNRHLDEIGLYGKEMIFSGKLRPDPEAWDDMEELEQYGADNALGPVLRDEIGWYFDVVRHECLLGRIEVDYYDPEVTEKDLYFTICSDTDERPNEGKIRAWIDEIRELNPMQPSQEMIEKTLARDFPDIFAALQTLPESWQDEAELIAALQDFHIAIDWTQYPDLPSDQIDAVMDMINDYITTRIGLDKELYEFSLKGIVLVEELTEKGKTIVPYEAPDRPVSARIARVQFDGGHEAEPDSSMFHHGIELEVRYPVRGKGYQLLWLPAMSIREMQSLVGEEWSEFAVIYDDPDEDTAEASRQVMSPVFRDTAKLVHTSETPSPIDLHDPSEPGISAFEYLEKFEDALTTMESSYQNVFKAAEALSEDRFETEAEAYAAAEIIRRALTQFEETYANVPQTLEFGAPGVQVLSAAYGGGAGSADDRYVIGKSRLTLDIQSVGIVPAELVAEKNGFFVQNGLFEGFELAVSSESDGYAVSIRMVCRNPEKAIAMSMNPEADGAPWVEVNTTERFKVTAGEHVHMRIIALERLREVQLEMDRFIEQHPYADDAVDALNELYGTLVQAQPTGLEDLEIDIVRNITDFIHRHPASVDDMVRVLGEMLKQRMLRLTGTWYTSDGMATRGEPLEGTVIDVVVPREDTMPSEPMISIQAKGYEHVLRVPLSKLQRVEF